MARSAAARTPLSCPCVPAATASSYGSHTGRNCAKSLPRTDLLARVQALRHARTKPPAEAAATGGSLASSPERGLAHATAVRCTPLQAPDPHQHAMNSDADCSRCRIAEGGTRLFPNLVLTPALVPPRATAQRSLHDGVPYPDPDLDQFPGYLDPSVSWLSSSSLSSSVGVNCALRVRSSSCYAPSRTCIAAVMLALALSIDAATRDAVSVPGEGATESANRASAEASTSKCFRHRPKDDDSES